MPPPMKHSFREEDVRDGRVLWECPVCGASCVTAGRAVPTHGWVWTSSGEKRADDCGTALALLVLDS